MKKLTKVLAAMAVLAVGGTAMTLAAEEKLGIEDVMNKGFKGKQSLLVKVTDGKASAEESKKLLEFAKALAANTPPKGDQAAWKKRTDAVVKAAEGVVAGTNGAGAQLRTATNCKACHNDHKAD